MTITPIPPLLHEALTDFGQKAVDGWWAGLEEAERREVIELWRNSGVGPSGLVRVAACPVNEGDSEDRSTLWHNDFYDYLVNHEIYILRETPFHICTRHPAAQAAIRAGVIPAGFACPLAQDDCPMQRLLQAAPGKAMRLRLAFGAIDRFERADQPHFAE
ncbi:MAG: hypothetical protein V4773_17165 [Verrucomicrobiota bacterium]